MPSQIILNANCVFHNVKLALTICLVFRVLETQHGTTVVLYLNATALTDLTAICQSNLIV